MVLLMSDFKLSNFRQLLVLLMMARLACRSPLISTSLCRLCLLSLVMIVGICLNFVSPVFVSC